MGKEQEPKEQNGYEKNLIPSTDLDRWFHQVTDSLQTKWTRTDLPVWQFESSEKWGGLLFGSGVWDEVIDQGWEGQYVSCRMISSSDSDIRNEGEA